ncbi:hypothetical protein OAC48_07095 [Porticoccaceae bacterium]|nr:hypothetical protein [Porticoccaceae bacterium]
MANLSSKVTPSGVATAAQGSLADSAVQPNDSPTFGDITATGTLTLPTAQYHYSSDGKARLYYYDNGDTLFRTADDFQFRNNSNATVAQIQDTGAISTISTMTATSFIGDGSALTGISSGAGTVVTWAAFNGAGISITNSGNVSSITDAGTGKFYVNYSTAATNATHSSTMSAVTNGYVMQANCSPIANIPTTTTRVSVGTGNSINGAFADMSDTNVICVS